MAELEVNVVFDEREESLSVKNYVRCHMKNDVYC